MMKRLFFVTLLSAFALCSFDTSYSFAATRTTPTKTTPTKTTASAAPTGTTSMGFTKKPDSSVSPAKAPDTAKPADKAPSTSMMGFTKKPDSSVSPSAKPADKAPAQQPTTSALGMTKKPVDSAAKPVVAAKASPMDKVQTQKLSQQSLAQYQADKARSTQPAQRIDVKSNPVYVRQTVVVRQTWHSPNDYYYARNRYYNTYYSSRPSYFEYAQHGLYPNYGMYDAAFLTMMMVRASDPQYYGWAYAHYNDPAYVQWHSDAVRLAAQNEEMQAQLAALDAKVSEMQASGAAPQDADAIPADADKSLVYAPEAVAQAEPEESSSHTWLWVLLGVGGVVLVLFLFRRSIYQATLRAAVR